MKLALLLLVLLAGCKQKREVLPSYHCPTEWMEDGELYRCGIDTDEAV